MMRRHLYPSLGACVLYMVLMLGIVHGASVGYSADSVGDTEIVYQGDYVEVGDERTDTTVDWEESRRSQPEYLQGVDQYLPEWTGASAAGDEIRSWTRGFTEQTVHVSFMLAFGASDITATFVYKYLAWWLPMIVLEGVFNLAGLVPLVYLLYLTSKVVRQIDSGGVGL